MKALFTGLMLSGMIRLAADGYLATVGPVPLRFGPQVKSKAGLPPLKMDNATPEPKSAKSSSALEIKSDSLLLRPETMRLEAPVLDLSPSFAVAVAPINETSSSVSIEGSIGEGPVSLTGMPGLFDGTTRTNSNITSQALLQIFNSTSRHQGRSSVVVPLQFIPGEPPPEPPSSRAEYRVSERK